MKAFFNVHGLRGMKYNLRNAPALIKIYVLFTCIVRVHSLYLIKCLIGR